MVFLSVQQQVLTTFVLFTNISTRDFLSCSLLLLLPRSISLFLNQHNLLCTRSFERAYHKKGALQRSTVYHRPPPGRRHCTQIQVVGGETTRPATSVSARVLARGQKLPDTRGAVRSACALAISPSLSGVVRPVLSCSAQLVDFRERVVQSAKKARLCIIIVCGTPRPALRLTAPLW